MRPKWGIYRSLNSASDLRDEDVLFSDFSVQEVSSLSISEVNENNISIYPNPAVDSLSFKLKDDLVYDKIEIYDSHAKLIMSYDKELPKTSIRVSSLTTGLYFILFKNKNSTIANKKFLID
ncbi:T9SS type A sorting domain-containing protein [Winogradskyella sp. PG-2]|uniref:T9SS type A sorting domain-containing protein n=1 Tax=Winogradskyella sp. PG-2 TaxID=754409 RepID=UPI00045869A3|nr:T9SS type A sorting domain-containing protein [Winogradskyella sp. PG-2]BAO76491.1 hypothetical protein WPG_2261 [Winogradskyella sp. PG-2]